MKDMTEINKKLATLGMNSHEKTVFEENAELKEQVKSLTDERDALKEIAKDFALSLSMAGKEINGLGGVGKYYRDKGYKYIEALQCES